MRNRAFSLVALTLSLGVGLSLVDLYQVQQEALVIYTTPALRDLLESFVVPQFRAQTGVAVTLVYVSAGEQYNRLRMSGGSPEADLFVHASPLFLEKGFAEGYFLPFEIRGNASVPAGFKSRDVPGGHVWFAFAWSPLAEVYDASIGTTPPDLASINTTFGFPHPLLSNNGVYSVMFFESLSPAAGAQALAHTIVQPANARANILGIAENAFDVTLGYEAVTLFYLNQGARVAFGLPVFNGTRIVTPAIFSAGLIKGHSSPRILEFVEFLFQNETQATLGQYYFRSVFPGYPGPADNRSILLPDPGATSLDYSWAQWRILESALPKYVVGG